MLENRVPDVDAIRYDTVSMIATLRERIQTAKENEKLRNELQERIDVRTKDREELVGLANYLVRRYKNVKSYAQNHRDRIKSLVDKAIEEAGDLVPDADVKGIHMETEENGNVYVVDENKRDINAQEGGGYRAVLGALLRYAAIKSQPDALQFMLFDEYFFTLSDVTTAAMQGIFCKMKEDGITVGVIEQRRNVMAGITDREYTFRKLGDNNSIITDTTPKGYYEEEVDNNAVGNEA